MKNANIRKKVWFTLGIIVFYRFLANVPPPGINVSEFVNVFKDNPITNYFPLMTGGRLDAPSLAMIGLGANINASIIIQLLTSVIPKLEELSDQGEQGRQILNQYTRYLTIPLSIIQGLVFYVWLSRFSVFISSDLINVVSFIATISAGSMLLMWLGELISEKGVGNGSSIIIAFSIISSLPGLVKTDIESVYPLLKSFIDGAITVQELITAPDFLYLIGVVFGIVGMLVILILMSEGIRKVTIQYARSGRTGKANFLPIRINQAGVVPIIFASALMTFPGIVAQLLTGVADPSSKLYAIAQAISDPTSNSRLSFLSRYGSFEYNVIFFVLIILFTFFYTFIILKPSETADNLKKSGGFIPGIRPGNSTKKYITDIMIRLTTIGALFLAFITIVPSTIRSNVGVASQNLGILSGIGGTSLLIVVSVLLSVYRQIKSMKVSKSYDQFR